jgi:hypothetical protein
VKATGLLSVRLERSPADALDVRRALATGRGVEEVADVLPGRLDTGLLDPATDAG